MELNCILEPKREPSIDQILHQLYPVISPESLDTSKVITLLNEQMSFKINDLLFLQEITKYVTNKDTLINCLKACDFLKLSENQESTAYQLPDNLTVFSMLNFPSKMSKEEVAKLIELDNLSYSRLYKRSVYWILATNDKETVICAQNALRDLVVEDIKIKHDMKTSSQLYKVIKDQLDKNSYSKEASNLGVGKKTEMKPNNTKDAFAWRKRGTEGLSSFDSVDKQPGYSNYSNYRPKQYDNKRNRFNSDNAPLRVQNAKPYYGHGNNKDNEEIEIDISNLKYSMTIKYKYSFQDMQQFFSKLQSNEQFKEVPKFLSTIPQEIYGDKPKEIVAMNSLIDQFEKREKKSSQPSTQSKFDSIPEVTSNVKIPKMNPLCGMPKMFNKFDMILGNIPQGNKTDSK